MCCTGLRNFREMCCINNAPTQVEIFEKLEDNKNDRHRNDSIRKGFLDPELYGEIRPE
jgi:hypothetical protein